MPGSKRARAWPPDTRQCIPHATSRTINQSARCWRRCVRTSRALARGENGNKIDVRDNSDARARSTCALSCLAK